MQIFGTTSAAAWEWTPGGHRTCGAAGAAVGVTFGGLAFYNFLQAKDGEAAAVNMRKKGPSPELTRLEASNAKHTYIGVWCSFGATCFIGYSIYHIIQAYVQYRRANRQSHRSNAFLIYEDQKLALNIPNIQYDPWRGSAKGEIIAIRF